MSASAARGGLENPWLRICLRHITADAVIPEKYFPNLRYPRVLILKSTEISIIPFLEYAGVFEQKR